MTLRQAVDLAMKQNPDIALSRLDELKARQGIRIAKDPFTPHISVGSGLAYTNGFPMSIEGSAPSIVQAKATQDLFNRQQSFQVAQAKEDARGAAIGVVAKRDEVAYRTVSLYLDAERAARVGEVVRKDIESRQRVLETIRAQVAEGRALPLTEKQAALAVAQARQSQLNIEDDQAAAETSLAIALGFSAQDRVHPVAEPRPQPPLPKNETQAVESAFESNKELRQLQSQITSKQLEVKGGKAARWPRVDLVAQYGLFAQFNNYSRYFNHFQRNNGEIGASFQLPLLAGTGVGAQMAQAEIDINRLKQEMNNKRNGIASDLQQSFRDLTKAQSAAEVARLDLEVAREQVSVDLAQMQEGRLPIRQLEEARVIENSKWVALYDAQYVVEKSAWNVLRLTGELVPAVDALP
jgi:outer membrane protein